MAPNDTSGGAVTAVEACCANCVETSQPPAMWARFTVFWGKLDMRTHWMAGAALHKNG